MVNRRYGHSQHLEQIIEQRATAHVISPCQHDEVIESWLQHICQEAFEVPSISWNDNLLEYGDSLTFLNFYLDLSHAIGRQLPWVTTTPTIARLASIIRNEQVIESGEQIVVRPATLDDAEAVCALLQRGFPHINDPAIWNRLFDYPWERLPPTYGFVLTADQIVVGYLGLIYASRTINGKRGIMCNMSSWYVEPAYRGWGGAMLSEVLAHDPSLTYTALTAAALPKAMIKVMEFTDSIDTSIVLPPLLHVSTLGKRPQITYDPEQMRQHLNEDERLILDDHAKTDCLHVLIRDGDRYAYLVVKRRPYRLRSWIQVNASKVLYCSNPEVFIDYLEWIKLSVMLRQSSIAMVVSGHWFNQPPQGVKVDSHVLLKSSVFEPRDLDMLYSELCLLPV